MMETFTSTDNLNYPQQKRENTPDGDVEGLDSMFYDHIKSQLDRLKKDPLDETITKILAYSKSKVI